MHSAMSPAFVPPLVPSQHPLIPLRLHPPSSLPALCIMSRRAVARPSPPAGDDPPPPRAPRKRPRNAPASHSQSVYRRAQSLSARGNVRAARAAFRAGVASWPGDGRLWLAWAQMEARLGRMPQARAVFEEGMERNVDNVRLLHAWAVEEERVGRGGVARTLLRRCLEIDGGDGIVWQAYALSEERAGRTERAREVFEKGVDRDPRNVALWSAWGVMEQRHGRWAEASRLFERAVQVDPGHVRTLQAWAITKERMGEVDESEQLFRRALQVSERSAPTYQAYALFSARRGWLERARELFGKGIQIDPNHAAIWHAWAVMEQRKGNYERARELFDRGVNAAPNSMPMLRAWAAMELELGHIDKSRDWLVPSGSRKGNAAGVKGSRAKGGAPNIGRDTQKKQMSAVGENLKMLRLMVERRTDEDVRAVMKWLDGRAQADRGLYDKLAERRESDSRKVTEWIARRSAGDIKAFKEWLDDRYEKDSRLGVYIFNWDIPSLSTSSLPVPVTERTTEREKPVEWLQLSEEPGMGLQAFDDELYSQETPTDYARGIYFMGQIAEGLADRAALILVLCAMSFGLIGFSGHLFEMGYSPYGDSTQTANEEPSATPPPSGVDAHLYMEGGAESVSKASRWGAGRR